MMTMMMTTMTTIRKMKIKTSRTTMRYAEESLSLHQDLKQKMRIAKRKIRSRHIIRAHPPLN
jgi:hypothetical protein